MYGDWLVHQHSTRKNIDDCVFTKLTMTTKNKMGMWEKRGGGGDFS